MTLVERTPVDASIDQNQFGNMIREARLKKSITLREAAKRLDISPAYLSSIECNTDGYLPNEDLIKKICKLTDLDHRLMHNLSKHIKGLDTLVKQADDDDKSNIYAFYTLAREAKLSTDRALELFKKAVNDHLREAAKRAR